MSVSATPVPSGTTETPAHATIYVTSDLSFVLTETSLALASLASTGSAAGTLTDPDAATTTVSPVASPPPAAATTLAAQALPAGIPSRIYPPAQLDLKQDFSGYTLISILFNQELNWPFVVNSPIASSQIFAFVPPLVYTALGVSCMFVQLCRRALHLLIFPSLADQVKTWVLQVYVPTTYTSPADQINLGTMWLGYIPSDLVDTLASLIKAKQSKFYTGVPIPAAQDLAERVNSGFSLRSVANPNTDGGGSGSGHGGTTSGGGSKGNAARQDAIIGVVSAFGAIALLVLVFLVYHSIKRKKELAHRRLSDRASGADVQVGGGGRAVGVRPEGREFDEDSVGGARRRSFYYAEDSLRGYQGEIKEEQMVQAQQEGVGGVATRMRTSSPQSAATISQRKAVVPAAISAPILRESSMNW
jgi:hypothetical protein